MEPHFFCVCCACVYKVENRAVAIQIFNNADTQKRKKKYETKSSTIFIGIFTSMCVLLPKRKKKKKSCTSRPTRVCCVEKIIGAFCYGRRQKEEEKRKKDETNHCLFFCCCWLFLSLDFYFILDFFLLLAQVRPISHLKIIFFIPLELSKDPGLTGGEENQQKVAKADDATGGTAKLRLIVISFAVEGERFNISSESRTRHDTQDNLRIWEVASPYSSF